MERMFSSCSSFGFYSSLQTSIFTCKWTPAGGGRKAESMKKKHLTFHKQNFDFYCVVYMRLESARLRSRVRCLQVRRWVGPGIPCLFSDIAYGMRRSLTVKKEKPASVLILYLERFFKMKLLFTAWGHLAKCQLGPGAFDRHLCAWNV